MSKLPTVSGQECIKALAKIGFIVVRQKGSHVTLVRDDPKSQVTVPNHKTLAKGTLRAILRHIELTVDEFISLL
ncbi:MAG: type II toxin-antitoxin system HicA family toxin [Cyanobacteria bacterium SBLK]|nr:type II toxin-antitoxin system HicA family toxin [Cyanobacteria bacterium SBLK]